MERLAIIEGQSLIDIAIRQHGTVAALFDLAAKNNLGVSDSLAAGQELLINSEETYSEPVLKAVAKPDQAFVTVISEGQNLLDVVLQETGSLESLFKVASLNNIAIAPALSAGQAIQVTEETVLKADVVKYYRDRKHRINTGSITQIIALPEGMVEHNESEYNESEHN